jgi:hypothetical protein
MCEYKGIWILWHCYRYLVVHDLFLVMLFWMSLVEGYLHLINNGTAIGVHSGSNGWRITSWSEEHAVVMLAERQTRAVSLAPEGLWCGVVMLAERQTRAASLALEGLWCDGLAGFLESLEGAERQGLLLHQHLNARGFAASAYGGHALGRRRLQGGLTFGMGGFLHVGLSRS